jgi:tetratricopeptide (TPR) repeat protein
LLAALLNRVISEHPEDATAYGDVGHALLLKKDQLHAIPQLEHALRLRPGFPAVENDLAWIYLTADDVRLRDKKAALRLARHAVATWYQPGAQASALDTLAEALLQNGMVDEALRMEQAAVQLDTGNAEMQARLKHIRQAAAGTVN